MKRTPIPAMATLMVLVALARVPYGYYMLLRLGLCVACIYYLWRVRPAPTVANRFVLGGLAFLYNPLVPVHLRSKPLWAGVNLATVAHFWLLELSRPSQLLKDGKGRPQ